MYTYAHACMHTYTRTYILTYIQACIRVYIYIHIMLQACFRHAQQTMTSHQTCSPIPHNSWLTPTSSKTEARPGGGQLREVAIKLIPASRRHVGFIGCLGLRD